MKKKQYVDCLKNYFGEILLVGMISLTPSELSSPNGVNFFWKVFIIGISGFFYYWNFKS